MKHWLSFLVFSAVLHLNQPLIAQPQGDAAAGAAVYTKSCATCHGVDGEAKEALAKALKVEIRHLASPEVQAKSDDELRKEVIEGTGKMKPVKGLSDKELSNLITYFRTLAKK